MRPFDCCQYLDLALWKRMCPIPDLRAPSLAHPCVAETAESLWAICINFKESESCLVSYLAVWMYCIRNMLEETSCVSLSCRQQTESVNLNNAFICWGTFNSNYCTVHAHVNLYVLSTVSLWLNKLITAGIDSEL